MALQCYDKMQPVARGDATNAKCADRVEFCPTSVTMIVWLISW